MIDIDSSMLDKLTKEDREDLELLFTQKFALTLFLCSDLTSYRATLLAIQSKLNKYLEEAIEIDNPDELSLNAALFSLIARAILKNVAFTSYGYLLERSEKGEINFSLEANEIINVANIYGLIASVYALVGTMEIYERDLGQVVFGVR